MNDDKSIQRGLEQDARLDSERIPMTEVNAKQKADALKRFMERHQFSISKIAKMVGYSPATISQFLNGRYKGDTEKLVTRIIDVINTVDRRTRRERNKPFIETTVAKRIGTVIKQTRAFSDEAEGAISLIIGDSGHGKSICLREFAGTNKNAIYVILDDAMSSTRVFTEIAKELGLDSFGSMDSVTRRIIEALENREAVLIIDEASSLTVKQLSQLRTVIVDKCRVPLILAGNTDLLKTVMQPKTRRGFESLDQFRSRLIMVLNLDEISARKDGGLYTADDIRRLYEYGGIRLTTDAVTTLRKIAKTPQSGRLRTCSRIVSAIHVSRIANTLPEIDAELIIKAIEELGLPVQIYLPVATGTAATEAEKKEAVAKVG